MNMHKIIKFWAPVAIWAVIIYLFSNRTTIKTVDFYLGDFLLKKTAHLIEYGVFSTLWYRALVNFGMGYKKAMFYSVLASFLYGASDEFHQSFIYGRTATLRDVAIDTTGALIAVYGFIENLKKMPFIFRFMYKKFEIKDTL